MPSSLGDFLFWLHRAPLTPAALHTLATMAWPPLEGDDEVQCQHLGPSISLWSRGAVHCETAEKAGGLALVNPPAGASDGTMPSEQSADPVLAAWLHARRSVPDPNRGRFCYLTWDAEALSVSMWTDPFRSVAAFYFINNDHVLCASDLRLILACGVVEPAVDPQAIYHYLNFSYIPAPLSPIKHVAKLPAGTELQASFGQARTRVYWDARYPEDLRGTTDILSAALRDNIVAAVLRHRPAAENRWGTFLSGGTDSSSISGILARNTPDRRVASFSIGFGEAAFDELDYARIAATHFGLDAHMRDVHEQDSVELLPRLVLAFDEPFGNSSAIPTYYCAQLARDAGLDTLVAGDGGDEIFGGNERYKKDQILEMYHRGPGLLHWTGDMLARALRHVDSRSANRIKNFIARGSLPNPDRFYSDDAFASVHYPELLSADFRAAVDRGDSLAHQRRIYHQAATANELHRLMYLDLKMTLADNDVVKVTRAARLAGINVVFPFLDPDLVAFTGRLPGHCKVRWLQKRFLFKRAMRDILPEAILNKTKQGFGLPISVWLRQRGRYRDLIHDTVLSSRALARGYFNRGFVQSLLERHERGAWDHSPEMYSLLMLELWHRTYLDGHDGK